MRRLLPILLLSSVVAIAEPLVPLLPPPVDGYHAVTRRTAGTMPRAHLRHARGRRALSNEEEPLPPSEGASSGPRVPIGLGIELGLLATPVNANADLLGLQALPGGRVFGRIPINRQWFVKPSIGYFTRSKGEADTSVWQNVVEGGVTVQFTPAPAHRLIWLFGLAQRVDMLFSRLSVLGSANTTPLSFRYRVGPSVGFSSAINRDFNFISDLELTFGVSSPVRAYGGLTLGLMYKLN